MQFVIPNDEYIFREGKTEFHEYGIDLVINYSYIDIIEFIDFGGPVDTDYRIISL